MGGVYGIPRIRAMPLGIRKKWLAKGLNVTRWEKPYQRPLPINWSPVTIPDYISIVVDKGPTQSASTMLLHCDSNRLDGTPSRPHQHGGFHHLYVSIIVDMVGMDEDGSRKTLLWDGRYAEGS